MHPRNYYSYYTKSEKTETLEELKANYDSIKLDIQKVKSMELSDELEQACIFELNKRLIEIKNKLHKMIEKM